MSKIKEFISKIKEFIKNNQFLSGLAIGAFGTFLVVFLLGLIL